MRIPSSNFEITRPPGTFDTRFLWLNISGGAPAKNSISYIPLSRLNSIAPGLSYPFNPQFLEYKQIAIPQKAETLEYFPANKCIYCGTTEYTPNSSRNLGEEHIISGSLGASLVLPRASCRHHEKTTSGIETKLIQGLFDPTRKHHDIRERGRKPILKGNFKVFRTVDGQDLSLPMPIKDHPTVLFLPYLAPPAIVTGRPKWLHGLVGITLININADPQMLKRLRITAFSTPVFDSILFAQLLAKIAHAFAAAELLLENFDPVLLDFIEFEIPAGSTSDIRDYFVGGHMVAVPPTPYLHELALGLAATKDQTFLVAKIRLFAFLGAPVYYVAVGTVLESKRSAVIARLSQNNSRTHAR
jgi:hypothetical protein